MTVAQPHSHPRAEERAAFLSSTPWSGATVIPLGSDASIRQYFRLEGGPSAALLMDAPSAAQEPPCPPEASEAQSRQLGYGALVRGSGSSLVAFEAAAQVLASCGVLVPKVMTRDLERGFAIVDDLGEQLISDVAKDPSGEARLYHAAADVLERLRSVEQEPGDAHGWPLQTYDSVAYLEEVRLLTEWYLPKVLGRELTDGDVDALDAVWSEAFQQLSAPRHLVHRDFHADNLLLSRGTIGVLDFQDLMIGQAAYDWMSLIEDARRDTPRALREELYQRGVQGSDDPTAFETDYAVLAAQRNAKILGLFARLAYRDGKRRYLDLMPRVLKFFTMDLSREPLKNVRQELERLAPELVR